MGELITHTSTAELERRWAAVRAAMADSESALMLGAKGVQSLRVIAI